VPLSSIFTLHLKSLRTDTSNTAMAAPSPGTALTRSSPLTARSYTCGPCPYLLQPRLAYTRSLPGVYSSCLHWLSVTCVPASCSLCLSLYLSIYLSIYLYLSLDSGRRILHVVLEHLMQRGMAQAEEVVFAGSSAGGMAALAGRSTCYRRCALCNELAVMSLLPPALMMSCSRATVTELADDETGHRRCG
jgi:hypothetical protein